VNDVAVSAAVLASTQLSLVGLVVLLLELAHFFDLVEVHDETGFEVVQVRDALPTKD